MTGAWCRDLDLDLDAIRDWGAVALVSLIEQHEIADLGVHALRAEVVRRHMDWLHLPIRDVSIPGPDFEQAWAIHGAGLRSRLRDGFDVVIHCKGGSGGRAPSPRDSWLSLGLRRTKPSIGYGMPDQVPSRSTRRRTMFDASLLSKRLAPPLRQSTPRIVLLELFSAWLSGTRSARRSSSASATRTPCTTTLPRGGPFKLRPGQWTDDTSMALALADSLIEQPEFDPADLMRRFVDWRDEWHYYSCTGRCFDIGMTVSAALRRWERTGDPLAGSPNPQTAGNGSLMRLAPVALRYWSNRDELHRIAAEQSRTTHAAPEAVSACVLFADMLADAIEGRSRREVFRTRDDEMPPALRDIALGSWRGKPRHLIKSTGYERCTQSRLRSGPSLAQPTFDQQSSPLPIWAATRTLLRQLPDNSPARSMERGPYLRLGWRSSLGVIGWSIRPRRSGARQQPPGS